MLTRLKKDTAPLKISGFLTQFMGCEPELFLLRLRFGNLRLCTLIWDRQKTRVLSAAAAVAAAVAVSKQSVKLFFFRTIGLVKQF